MPWNVDDLRQEFIGLRRSTHPLVFAGLLLGWLSAGPAAAEADPPSAREVVAGQIKDALAVLRDAKLTPAQKRQKIGDIADRHTDFETMSRLTLGRYWRDLSAEQRAAFVEAFKTHLSNLYGNLLNGYTDEDVTVAGDRREPNGDCTVQLRVIGTVNGTRLELAKVDCRLRKKAEWKAIDVIADGVSVVALFRAQFQDIMANGGFDRLLKLLREKVGEPGNKGPQNNQKESRQSGGGDPVGIRVCSALGSESAESPSRDLERLEGDASPWHGRDARASKAVGAEVTLVSEISPSLHGRDARATSKRAHSTTRSA